MASATRKVKRIRRNKVVASGQRRKRAIRHDLRVRAAEVAEKMGLATPGLLATKPTE